MLLLAQIPDPTDVIENASRYSWEAGVLSFLVVALFLGAGVGLWKITWFLIHKIFGDESKGTPGLAGDWVAGEKEWRGELTKQLSTQTERLQLQTVACSAHVETVQAMGESLAAQISAAQKAQEAALLAQNAASMAANQMAEGNIALAKIDATLQGRTELLQHTADGMTTLKGCLFHLCDLCQAFVAKEFPGSLGDVSGYLLAIKKKINDEQV